METFLFNQNSKNNAIDSIPHDILGLFDISLAKTVDVTPVK